MLNFVLSATLLLALFLAFALSRPEKAVQVEAEVTLRPVIQPISDTDYSSFESWDRAIALTATPHP